MAKSAMYQLDSFDYAILDLMQDNNQLPHAEIGARVNLSASSVRRRVGALRAAGVIRADVSLVDPALQGLSFMVHVWMNALNREKDTKFRQMVAIDPMVSQCYSVSGEYDYVLIAHAPTPSAFETWAEIRLMELPAVERYTSALVWSQIKFDTKVVTDPEGA